jgi:hypothetical protein
MLSQIPALVVAAALLFSGSAAFGGDGINVTITNDGVADIYVSVYDATTKAPLAEHQRLNGFTSISISANPDASGQANISWTTISVDNRERHCGRGTRSGLANDATVNVHADSSCP